MLQRSVKFTFVAAAVAAAAAVAIPGAAFSQQAPIQDEATVKKATQAAQDWLDGKLSDYGTYDIKYAGDPITLRLTSHLPEVAAQAKFLKKSFLILEKMSNGKLKFQARWGATVH